MTDNRRFQLDKRLVRAAFDQSAQTYDQAATLQREVGKRILERLDYVRLMPAVIMDVGCGTGITFAPLLKKYKKAHVIALDISPAMLARARKHTPKHTSWFRKPGYICGDAEALPLADASCDLLFSNLTVQWCQLDLAFREFRRVLRPGGLLMFSTLGPDTLMELRHSWEAADGYNHVNAFIDMHDVGDALVRAGLADPVMDVERISITYQDVFGLMRDLKNLGAHNVSAGRPQALTGKGRLRAMQAAYERFRREDGLLPATYEVVYGLAWAPDASLSRTRENGVAVFPVSQLRHR